MTYTQGFLSGVAGTLALVALGFGTWWLLPSGRAAEAAKPTPPASVYLKEEKITEIKLTPDAEQRLGITLGKIEEQPTRRLRTYGGEAAIPLGATVIVAAPLSGILAAPTGGGPRAGQTLRKGDVVFHLAPLLTPEARTTLATARVDAEGKYESARTDADNKKLALDRARRLADQQAGSRRAVEEAQAAYDIAQRTLTAFQGQRDLLVKVAGEVERGTAAPLPIVAPHEGSLRTLTAQPGQHVPAGGALFEVADLRTMWVRVPVYVGDLNELAAEESVQVGSPTQAHHEPTCTAWPVPAPPVANPLSGTADLVYELSIRAGGLAPGQRVAVAIPLRGAERGPVVPWSAVIHDIHGGTWVYAQVGALTYQRRRVQVRYVAGDRAVLADPKAVGATVVTAGAAELFGTEVGFSK